VLLAHHAGQNSAEAPIRMGLKDLAHRVAGGNDGERPPKTQASRHPAGVFGNGIGQIHGQAGIRELEDSVGVPPPRVVHGRYMLATMASANSLVRSRVAPSITRWKS
jgi:hypothetical protein